MQIVYFLDSDIDECKPDLDSNKCTQRDTCTNTEGRYNCSCSFGFKLETDQRTCTG